MYIRSIYFKHRSSAHTDTILTNQQPPRRHISTTNRFTQKPLVPNRTLKLFFFFCLPKADFTKTGFKLNWPVRLLVSISDRKMTNTQRRGWLTNFAWLVSCVITCGCWYDLWSYWESSWSWIYLGNSSKSTLVNNHPDILVFHSLHSNPTIG